jgi:hypothetical protein
MSLRSHLLNLAVCLFAFAAVLIPTSSAQQQPEVPAPHKHAFALLPLPETGIDRRFSGRWSEACG